MPEHGDRLLMVGASAGSGKTYRLTEEVIGAVDPTSATPIHLEGLVAVTYTRKAAAELQSRIRHQLQRQDPILLAELGRAHIGTVHAVCLRLIKEFALDAGISPSVDVIPDDGRRLLREVLEREMPLDLHERMTSLAERLQIRFDQRIRRHDWVTPVEEIMTLARSNRVKAQDLEPMAARSLAGLLALLPPDVVDGNSLDSQLDTELRVAIGQLESLDDHQNNTAEALNAMRTAARLGPASTFAWGDWARLSRLVPGESCRPAVAKLVEIAGQYEHHPRLRQDIREYTEGAFTAARIGLEHFSNWKARRRAVDYVDMIDLALSLLDLPAICEELEGRLQLVVVDEFQDTSPIQLALFARLHRLGGRSVWVGDRKQCIFEYAGADPALMDSALRWCRQMGGAVDQLPKNYRSRPELVNATSALFTSAFAPYDIQAHEVVVTPHRTLPPSVAALPPIGLWGIDATKNEEDAAAIAIGVGRLLATPAHTMVIDPQNEEVRPLRPADIAIIVSTNGEAEKVAAALEKQHIRAARPRQGLLLTPEGQLIVSALEYVLDASARLPRATIEALLAFDGLSYERWFDQKVAQADGKQYASEEEPAMTTSTTEAVRVLRRLDALRERITSLAPSEVLLLALADVDIPRVCARWPDASQRLGNVDALQGLARTYEHQCHHENEAATLAGLLRYFRSFSASSVRRKEFRAADHQHIRTGIDAVTVCTYHKAKGLEWPVVVLASLDRPARSSPFDVCPETDRPSFDPNSPLGGRWIRYWAWPFGQQKDLPLARVTTNSAEGRRVADNERRERIRLLYVGFTRARDHLILAARLGKKGAQTQWLDELKDRTGRPLLQLPWDATGGRQVEIHRPTEETMKVPARVWRLTPTTERVPIPIPESPRWFSRGPAIDVRPSYWVAPSRAATEWTGYGECRIGEIVRIGPGVPVGSNMATEEWGRLGTAVHAFFAADDDGLPDEERLARAQRLFDAAMISPTPRVRDLLNACDALRAFINARWAGARVLREIPVLGTIGDPGGVRRVRGAIDMLAETPTETVIIDHKLFPGSGDGAWSQSALEYFPQLLAYARVLKMGPASRVIRTWIHFVASGVMVEVLGPAAP